MTSKKSPKTPKAERARQIEDAVKQIQEEGLAVSFTEVARRLDISTTLIHLKFPLQAQAIRTAAGIVQDDAQSRLRDEVARLGEVNSRLNSEVAELKRDLAKQASINEALRRERAVDSAVKGGKVLRFQAPSPAGDN